MCMGSVDSCSNPYGTLVDADDDDSSVLAERVASKCHFSVLVFQGYVTSRRD